MALCAHGRHGSRNCARAPVRLTVTDLLRQHCSRRCDFQFLVREVNNGVPAGGGGAVPVGDRRAYSAGREKS